MMWQCEMDKTDYVKEFKENAYSGLKVIFDIIIACIGALLMFATFCASAYLIELFERMLNT